MTTVADRELETQRLLGTILERVDGLRRDFSNFKTDTDRDFAELRNDIERQEQSAVNGRKALYERMDETIAKVGGFQNGLDLSRQQIAQMRDIVLELDKDMKATKSTLKEDVMPVVKTVALIEGAGKKYLVRSAMAGASIVVAIGGVIAANWEHIWNWIKTTF